MPPQIAQTVSEIKLWLTKQPKVFLAAAAAIFLVMVSILYVPPWTSIRRLNPQWMRLRAELADIRRVVEPFHRGEIHGLPRSEDLVLILEQLNALARAHQIQVLEVSPGTARPAEPKGLLILPMDLHLEGSFRSIGEFLGEIRRTSSLGAVFLKRLSIEREERLLPKLRARLSLEMCLSEGSGDGS